MNKKVNKFCISDYEGTFSDIGISYRGEKILFGWEQDVGEREYLFKLKIFNHKDRLNILLGKQVNQETLSFYLKCDLRSFVYEIDCKFEKDLKIKDLDFLEIINSDEEVKSQYQYLCERLERKEKAEPKELLKITEPFYEGDFLEFTEETAGSWGGPLECNYKLGCGIELKTNKNGFSLPELNYRTKYSYYDLCDLGDSKTINKLIGKKGNTDRFLYNLTPEEKSALFNKFPIKIQHGLYKLFLKKMLRPDYCEELLPYSVYLYGNDDCSYTKYFATEEEQLSELNYLSYMQPLDFNLDVTKRGYVFTN